jgi:hypothetical protein
VNSNLYGEIIYLPKELLDHLTVCFEKTPNADSNVEGFLRNKELRDSGYLTYQQMGRIKNWFDNYSGDGKDAPYILNGSDYMRNWVNLTLDSMRNADNLKTQVRNDYHPEPVDQNLKDDMGWLADLNRPSKEHKSSVDDLKITEDLKRINEIMKKII